MRATRSGTVNERIKSRYEVDKDTGCWNWTGSLFNGGYGRISGWLVKPNGVEKVREMLAHRASWIIHNGDIPKGEGVHGTVVLHKCDNRACINPDHLMLGTQSDNVKDMIAKGRKVVGEYQRRKGIEHFNSAFTNQEDIDLILNTQGSTKELAEKFGVSVSCIKRIRQRNGKVSPDADKFKNKALSPEAIAHIRSTKPGTRGLGKLYGVGKTTIANIRKGLTHKD